MREINWNGWGSKGQNEGVVIGVCSHVRSGNVRVWEVMGDLCVRPSVTPSIDLAPVPSLLCEIILCTFFHANRRVIKSNLVMCHTIYIL